MSNTAIAITGNIHFINLIRAMCNLFGGRNFPFDIIYQGDFNGQVLILSQDTGRRSVDEMGQRRVTAVY